MIRLQRTVAVHTFEAEGTVALGRNRPEFLAVARLAKDLGSIDGNDVARELLAGLPEAVGWRAIDRCIALGLLRRTGDHGPAALSEGGDRALSRGEVLVPEEGAWLFAYVADPLIEAPILHCARLQTPRASDERREFGKRRREGGDRPQSDAIPTAIDQARSSQYVGVSVTGEFFQVRRISSQGQVGPDVNLHLELTWSEGDEPDLRLRGDLPAAADGADGVPVDMRLDLPQACRALAYEDVWLHLAAAAIEVPPAELRLRQNGNARAVPARFEDLDEKALRSMKRDLEVPATSHPQLGAFEATKFEGVQIVPRSGEDAEEWALWLQWDAVAAYSTPEGLRRAAGEIGARFPVHRPQLLGPEALLKVAMAQPTDARSRYLLAPYDLGLWR